MTTAQSHYQPLRNFTPQQWRDIVANLPKGAAPTDEARLNLVIAANVYWEIRVGPQLRDQARLVAEAVDHLQQAKDNIRVAAPQFQSRDQLAPLETLLTELNSWRDVLQSVPIPSLATLAKSRHEEFLDAALNFWLDCGGKLSFSRSPRGPTGPLIRYLTVLSDTVMGEDARKGETLAAFIQRRKR